MLWACRSCAIASEKNFPGPGAVRSGFFWLLLCLGVALSPGQSSGAVFEVQGVSRPVYKAQLSFALPGTVFAIAVKPGQAVSEGDLLMHLDTRVEDKRLELLDHEISNDIKLRNLSTRIEQARLDMDRFASALKQKAATQMEAQHAKLNHSLSKLALEEEEFRIAQLVRNREELLAQRERMRLYAPCDGYIEDILVERGMAVDKNVPAVLMLSINPLQIDLTVSVEQAMQITTDTPVEIVLPGSGATLQGKVVQVAKIAVLSNRTLKVRVEAPNPEQAPVGMLVTVRFPGIAAAEGE